MCKYKRLTVLCQPREATTRVRAHAGMADTVQRDLLPVRLLQLLMWEAPDTVRATHRAPTRLVERIVQRLRALGEQVVRDVEDQVRRRRRVANEGQQFVRKASEQS